MVIPAEEPYPQEVRQAIRRALVEGCKKHVNVFFDGPNTMGKSHVVKPLMVVFKCRTFKRRVGLSNFPRKEIFNQKVCVLQDVRVSFKVGFDSLPVWWEGDDFPVPLPQNPNVGDREYTEKAPVFISAGAKFEDDTNDNKRSNSDFTSLTMITSSAITSLNQSTQRERLHYYKSAP